MIRIAGGVYLEHCLRPGWDGLYGSGGRAAAALSEASEVDLVTYVAPTLRRDLAARADAYSFNLHAHDSPFTVQFSYAHPLSTPLITPPRHEVLQLPPLKLEGQVLLRFGFMECDLIALGERVVYDPQSATDPQLFRSNGSTASSLAIVANATEVRLLTGEHEPLVAARVLLARDRAEVVVVKRGARGALVVTPGTVVEIPAYKQDLIFTIGSGDVFTAAFALYWAEQRRTPEDAAHLASRATSLYCVSRSLPPPTDAAQLASLQLDVAATVPGRVYLAAPFFTLAQRWLVEEARTHLLDMGLDVFSPVHDVGPGDGKYIAPADLAGLDQCDRVLALVDGADVGTIFEVGYARAKSLFVIALAETLPPDALKMIEGSGCILTNDFATAIYRTAWRA